jgi:hypothetical protein
MGHDSERAAKAWAQGADKAITHEIDTHVLGELLGRPGTGHLARPAVGF